MTTKSEPGTAVPRRSTKAKNACAICGRPRDPHYDPFCSKRCADVDLYRWLKGGYVIPGAASPPGEEDEEES
jgi:endogenous inhibitor of DNA gyrase (YacG/DUF329 family)